MRFQYLARDRVDSLSNRQLDRYVEGCYSIQGCQLIHGIANGSLEGIWAMLEISLGIVCACVVLMRPLFHDCHTFLRRHFGSEKNSSSANDSVVNSATSVQKSRLDSWSPEPWSSEAEIV